MPFVNTNLELARDDKETKWTITTVFTLSGPEPVSSSTKCEKWKCSFSPRHRALEPSSDRSPPLCVLLLLLSLQSCPTPCGPVPGILQATTLEWVAISFSNASKWKVKVKSLSHVQLFTTPWTAAYQAPPSMGFSRQEYWSGVPLPSPHSG